LAPTTADLQRESHERFLTETAIYYKCIFLKGVSRSRAAAAGPAPQVRRAPATDGKRPTKATSMPASYGATIQSASPSGDDAAGCRSDECCCMSANVGSTAMVTFHFGSFSWPERENEVPRSRSVGPGSHSAAPGQGAWAAHASRRADASRRDLAPFRVSCLESSRHAGGVTLSVTRRDVQWLSAPPAYARHSAGARALVTGGEGPSGRQGSIDRALGIPATGTAPGRLGIAGRRRRRAAIRAASRAGDGTAAGGAVRTGPCGEMGQHQEQGDNKNPHAGSIGRGSKML
jgi:hypothetical protein